MFQSNKEYLNFLIQSGVHTFQETPNNFLENQKKIKMKEKEQKKFDEITKIDELIL